MKTMLFCLPFKENALEPYKKFIAETSTSKKKEWQDMLQRYDMHNVKVWMRNIEGKDYCFVYHQVGPKFDEKIQGWTTSTHEFDRWFDEQLGQYYAIGATEAMAENLLELDA